MANILVIRLSAIGDVAMTVPVIYSAAKANPTDSFTVLTQAFLIGFYQPPEERERDRYQYEEHGENVGGVASFCLCLGKI